MLCLVSQQILYYFNILIEFQVPGPDVWGQFGFFPDRHLLCVFVCWIQGL